MTALDAERQDAPLAVEIERAEDRGLRALDVEAQEVDDGRRVVLLEVLRSALSASHDVAVRIGTENDTPALRSLALVAASYGLPQRSLGTVSVIGPLRMDYGRAIHAVRDAAAQLSSFVADVYDER